MTTIYKYQINVTDLFSIKLPVGYEVLSIQVQDDVPFMWCKINEGAPTENVYFSVVGTGHQIPPVSKKYLGTFQLNNGRFVGHLFEVYHYEND